MYCCEHDCLNCICNGFCLESSVIDDSLDYDDEDGEQPSLFYMRLPKAKPIMP